MKPPKKFIKWLQAHPAVWEALQEGHEWSDGDWGYDTDAEELYLMSQDTGTLLVLGTMAGVVKWLPTLGQLVRLLDAAGCEEFWAHFHMQGRTVAWLPSGVNEAWDGDFTRLPEAPPQGMEPEIACTALWAKVKGV